MGELVDYLEMRIKRFSIEMKKIVDEIVKIEKKWSLRATTIYQAREDLENIKVWINKLLSERDKIEKMMEEKSANLSSYTRLDAIKIRLENAKAKVIQALKRGE